MSTSTATWAGAQRLQARLARLGKVTLADVAPLLEEGRRILAEGNRDCVMSGMQPNGQPMPPVKYRSSGPGGAAGPRGHPFGAKAPAIKGERFGSSKRIASSGGRSSAADYKRLNGPPLAPHGERSRVITNLVTEIGESNSQFYVTKRWRDVVGRNGRPFLMAHFTGATTGRNHSVKLPKRDLRGISEFERKAFATALRRWAGQRLRGQ